MVALADRPVGVSGAPTGSAPERRVATGRGGAAAPAAWGRASGGERAPHAYWRRWRPWAAPRVRLGACVRPQTRLELALCALFRCQREWPAGALVARLADAPRGSDDNRALDGRPCAGPLRPLGRGAAWDALSDWLARGLVVECAPARRALVPGTVAASRDVIADAGATAEPARSPG